MFEKCRIEDRASLEDLIAESKPKYTKEEIERIYGPLPTLKRRKAQVWTKQSDLTAELQQSTLSF